MTLVAISKSIKNNIKKVGRVYHLIYKDSKAKHKSQFQFLQYQLIYLNKRQNINQIVG